ncbi:MAG TPA: hypothetical protein VE153_40105 [Myxococcus sp.]|nr:hypothetical protein [Myxococcus sp.]
MAVRPRRPLPVPLSLLLLALAGCGTELPDGEASLATGKAESDIRIANSLPTDALVLNAIATNAQANGWLATRPLTQLFHPSYASLPENSYLRVQLRDPDAQEFMGYLVGCALKSGQDLQYYDPLGAPPGPKFWRGSAGLCPQWAGAVPSQECLNRVSACILARNNALGKRVELSIRGEIPSVPAAFPLEAVTRPSEHDPDTKAWLPSFQGCSLAATGAARDCGWQADAIGACTPGSTVWVGAGGQTSCPGSTLGSTSSPGARMVLRVCSGTVGCDHLDSRFLAKADSSCAGTAPAVSFTCPTNGYFSVMTAPWDSQTSGSASVAVGPSTSARYRLSELEVFSMREGAFYGNIFDPRALATQVEVRVVRVGEREAYEVVGDDAVIQGSIYRRMYSCYDPAWADGSAYSTSRVCALPNSGANCAASVVGPCWNAATPSLGKCATQDGPILAGDGDFEQCRDPYGNVWREPVTVFLHEACGPVQNGEGTPACARKRLDEKL